ncbi:MAG: WD40-repeat-containing domain protein, partial [Olpidium bornovanus]
VDGPAPQLEEEEEEREPEVRVYLPGQQLQEGEELVHDASAYHMLHSMSSRWPCLSFDIVVDKLGDDRSTVRFPRGAAWRGRGSRFPRTEGYRERGDARDVVTLTNGIYRRVPLFLPPVQYPHTVYAVAGTQADSPEKNEVYVMKMSQLNRTARDAGEDSDSEDDDGGLDDDPILEHRVIPHRGGVSRVRLAKDASSCLMHAATWADTGKVHIWDISSQLAALDVPGAVVPHDATKPVYTVENHGDVEGFAMDWSDVATGRLLTGDVSGRIFLTTRTQTGYTTSPDAFTSHTSSVEDIQFSPVEKTVFASCSADGTVRVWDTRVANRKAVLGINAHESDVNVISWNRLTSFLLASGSDGGEISVWDMRKFSAGFLLGADSDCTAHDAVFRPLVNPAPVASFLWHNAPVTSIEWSPFESSVLAAAGADDQVSIWDLSVEADVEEEGAVAMNTGDGAKLEVPPQLLFIHQGQRNIKELHWHRCIRGVVLTTAASGFNVFKPINF